jgi:ATP-dependent exoDNAse (exonuclease V) beta subunit
MGPGTWNKEREKDAKELGSRVHHLLEGWDFENADSTEVEEALQPYLQTFLDSDIRSRAVAARRYFKEMPFSVMVDGQLHEGFIDLVIEEEDGLVLIDYKSDRVADKEAARRRLDDAYLGQGEFYRRALTEAGFTVKEVGFLFLAPGCLLRV